MDSQTFNHTVQLECGVTVKAVQTKVWSVIVEVDPDGSCDMAKLQTLSDELGVAMTRNPLKVKALVDATAKIVSEKLTQPTTK